MQIALGQLDAPVRVIPAEPISVEAFFQLSANNPDLRMEREPNGELIVMTPTNRDTGFRGSYITRALGNWAEADDRGYDFDSSTGFILPDGSVRSPDAAWISSDRWKPGSDSTDEFNTRLCPDFVIELRFQSDRLPALQAKMQSWRANGAQLAWLIDPTRKTVEIYRPGKPTEVQEGHTAVYGENPVGGFILELARIWA